MVGAIYPNLGSTRWIVASEGDGATLTLDDGSLWLVEETEIDIVRRWSKTQTVVVGGSRYLEASYDLRSTDEGDEVRAHYLGFERIAPLSVLAPEIGLH